MKLKSTALNVFFIGIFSPFAINNAVAGTVTDVGGGTISFSGSVTDVTCDVTTGNGNDFTVSMTPITTSDLGTSVGVVSSNAQQFTINVSGCSGFNKTSTSAQSLNVTFTGTNVSDDEKYLKNASGTATGVGVGITTDGSTLVSLNSALKTGLTTTASSSSAYDTAASGDIVYYANYYNYGGSSVGTGSVVTTATYTFSYE